MNGLDSDHTPRPGQAARVVSMGAVGPGSGHGRDGDWTTGYVATAVVCDFLVVSAGTLLGFFLRFPGTPHENSMPYVVLSVALPFLWVGVLAFVGAYDRGVFGEGSEEYRRVFRAGFVLVASIAIGAYALKMDVARGYVITALPLATLLDFLCRYLLRKGLHRMRARGRCMRTAVVVGHAPASRELVRQLRREPYHGLDVVAVCLPHGPLEHEELDGVPVLGDFAQANDVVKLTGARTVAVLACPEMDAVALRRLAWKLESDDVELCVAPALMDVAGPRISIRPVAGLPLLHVEHPELSGTRRTFKSLFDRTVALLLLAVAAPVMLAIAGCVGATSRGPVFFRQVRVGKDGRTFVVYKFRTMVAEAERLRPALVSEGDGLLFKIRRDPRITPVGSWLRKYSLDELPQLLNVLKGDMSLVGPRPPLPEEVRSFPADVRRRLAVKPGMTGLWQVSGRSDLSWEDSVRLDLRYVENWTLAMDLQIIWRTVATVVRGDGAY
ncbi:sugar transferase [Actinocorallia sp. API 0066]|uniref:sugar transferase n=1 Tax=Actinocorallia sp. API 0066 TaxID=2896846 RepID=UPI001E646577|nr:sugar transferase [Actinocorallia sp. API 0066]MCD0447801.1 sugar transferase [Actinocorallia sp. API 0066]